MCVLSIAVPIFNMEWCLEKNLATYNSSKLAGKLEVLCLNNASEDGSKRIIEDYVRKAPEIFHLIDRATRGYGSSINEALSLAKGKYFRIVDADDWVNTEDLIRQVEELETCDADVILSDYQVVSLKDDSVTSIKAGDYGAEYKKIYTSFDIPSKTLPLIYCISYRTEMLKQSGFYMQDNIFFVDEEYIVLPFLSAKTILYQDYDIYRYATAIPEQSTSPKNRARFQSHREKVLRRLIQEYKTAQNISPEHPALPYCKTRIMKGIGDHFTTLLIYVEDRNKGAQLARQWESYIKDTIPEFWPEISKKASILYLLNSLHIPLSAYLFMKNVYL